MMLIELRGKAASSSHVGGEGMVQFHLRLRRSPWRRLLQEVERKGTSLGFWLVGRFGTEKKLLERVWLPHSPSERGVLVIFGLFVVPPGPRSCITRTLFKGSSAQAQGPIVPQGQIWSSR